jgi:hypothetical protein
MQAFQPTRDSWRRKMRGCLMVRGLLIPATATMEEAEVSQTEEKENPVPAETRAKVVRVKVAQVPCLPHRNQLLSRTRSVLRPFRSSLPAL